MMRRLSALRGSVLALLIILWTVLPSAAGVAGKRLKGTSRNSQTSGTLVGRTITVLPSGNSLLLGGTGPDGPVPTAAIENPQTGGVTILPHSLRHARTGHTATVLPNGMVLVLGGIGASGHVETTAELFDPSTETFRDVSSTGLLARAYHSATVLTDGDVLVAGGTSDSGSTLGNLELWDFRTGAATNLSVSLLVPRSGQMATLLANGTVLFSGGFDQNGAPLTFGEVFDPVTLHTQLEAAPSPPTPNNQPPSVETSMPEDGTGEVPVNALLSFRFSEPLSPATINSQTTTLSGPEGLVPANVVAAESGMLAFIIPKKGLTSGAAFTVTLDGVTDPKGVSLAKVQFSFTTANPAGGSTVPPDTTSPGAGGLWTPPAASFQGIWRSGQGQSPWQKLPPLQANPNVTALAGQALRLNGLPLSGVTVEIGGEKATTDRTGRFLLPNLASGHQVLLIDGSTANTQKQAYGIYEVGVDLLAGRTTVLNYTIWMTQLDTAHAATIPSPTTAETVVSTPLLPGLELHLPANTVIRDHNGNVVTHISITPIPIDQPPFPLPAGVNVPIYFTIQPGGAYIDVSSASWTEGARLFYPNSHNAKPGTSFDFWNYDADEKGWYVYGEGKVSKDGKQIVPDAGVEIYEFTGAMVGTGAPAPGTGPTGKPSPQSGEPVDLSSGLFVYNKTDLVLPDVIPIVLQRTYRTNDNQSRAFGIGATQYYDMFLFSETYPYTSLELVLPDGSRIYFPNYSSDPATVPTADFVHTSSQTIWYGSTITWDAPLEEYLLTRRDGMKFFFESAESAGLPLLGIQDRYGNTVEIDRDGTGNITQISSPNGRRITLQYDSVRRITQAQDNAGRTVSYTYDSTGPTGRLSTVTDAKGGVTTYTYDSNDNMLTVEDARGITYLTNQYDSNGRVTKQTLADGSTYQFAWTPASSSTLSFSESGGSGSLPPGGSASAVIGFRNCSDCSEGYLPLVSKVDVTDPNGNVREVQFGSTGQMTSDTYAFGTSQSQAFTYTYYPDNLLQSVVDPLSRTTSYTYDANGNVTGITRLSGTSNAVTTSLSYDPNFSQLTSVTDPLSHTTSFAIDGSGNTTSITDPLSHQTTFTYNSEGQVTSVTDPLSNETQFSYSGGDLVSVTDPLSRTTNRFVDNAGRLISLTNALGQTTKYAYDNLNEVTSVTDPLNGQTAFGYDANGNLTSVTDANSHATSYTYNNMDRLTGRADPLSRSESYSYDSNGNLTQFTDRRGKVTTYTYDNLNRKTFAGFNTVSGPAYDSTITNTYDAGNRLTQAVDSVTGTISRTYDGLDRMTQETTPQGTVSYAYDGANRRTSMTVAGQTAVSYTYDNANRLTQIARGTPTVSLAYDNANRRTSITLPNGVVMSYGYDSGSELTGITYTNGSTTLGTLTYAYDLAGRRTSVGGSYAATGLPNAISLTAYDAANELTTWGTATPTYDSNGNITSDGTNSYVWNARNQLASMNSGGASFQYDPFGRRVAKTIISTTTNYLYNGANPVQELAGSTPTANLLTGGVDEYFTRTDSSATANFLTDALGSTLALTDGSGGTLASYAYEPFGNTTTSGSSANTYQYTGGENDGTGIYFYRARYYSPTLQRFVSEDPLRFGGGDANLYAYVGNSPANFTDSFGTARDCFTTRCGGVPSPQNPLPGRKDNGSSPGIPANPCQYAGRALPASAYAAAGATAADSPATFALDIWEGWRGGHYLDPQGLGSGTVQENAAYGNYVYGVYMQSAGLALPEALSGANAYAWWRKFFNPQQYANQQMDANYGSLPAANISNITNGYNAQQNGTVCH